MSVQNKPVELFVATSNLGKLREYRALAAEAGAAVEIAAVPDFDAIPPYDESALTFGENAAGKAFYYSQYCKGLVLADDSGLVVPALGGAPGVHSARYAGPNATDADRIRKLLCEMRDKYGEDRQARFVCVLVLADSGTVRGIFSAAAEGTLLEEPRGNRGFGYDPIFFFPNLGRTYAEISSGEKNVHSHRGKAFRKALDFLSSAPVNGAL